MVNTGTIANLKVNKDFEYAYFWLKEDDGSNEIFILWDTSGAPYDYLYHSTWLNMIRDALTNNLTVQIGHDESSSYVNEIFIGRSQ